MKVRIGGVPEHFNLPWLLAIEEGAFDQLGIDAEWIDYGGGTGAIMSALEAGEVDIATPLTEGAITSIANGNSSQLLRVWVQSPLYWGIFTGATSLAETVADLEGHRFAISRFGSGSELMSRVLADDLGWTITDDQWVAVGNLEGALAALPGGAAEIFLWSKSMTQPHVDDGTFKRVGVLETPWPSFATVGSGSFLQDNAEVASVIAETAAHRAAALAVDETTVLMVTERYGLGLPEATEWFDRIEWAAPDSSIDPDMITAIEARMRAVGRIS